MTGEKLVSKLPLCASACKLFLGIWHLKKKISHTFANKNAFKGEKQSPNAEKKGYAINHVISARNYVLVSIISLK